MIPDLTCDFCGQTGCPPCSDADRWMQRAIDRLGGLLEVLEGPSRRPDACLNLIVLGEFCELSEAEGRVVDSLIARIRAAFDAYRYTAADAAQLLGISERQVRHLARRGEINSAVIGGRRMFTDRQIERYLAPGGSPKTSDQVSAIQLSS